MLRNKGLGGAWGTSASRLMHRYDNGLTVESRHGKDACNGGMHFDFAGYCFEKKRTLRLVRAGELRVRQFPPQESRQSALA
jgi:hypothetical protein